MRPTEDQGEASAGAIPGTAGIASDSLFDRHLDKHRIAELEIENARLQKLVAELLLKNQQLRKPE